jgi:hypothetical protein
MSCSVRVEIRNLPSDGLANVSAPVESETSPWT